MAIEDFVTPYCGVCTNHGAVFSHIQISPWLESERESWEVNQVRIVLSHELEHYRNQNCECRRVASLTLAIAIADVRLDYMTNWIPGWQAALWPCPRPLPSGSGHVRLVVAMLIVYSIQTPATQSFSLHCLAPHHHRGHGKLWSWPTTEGMSAQDLFVLRLISLSVTQVLLVLKLISLSVMGCCGLCIPTCLPYITSFVVKYQVFPSSCPASVEIVWSDLECD